MLVYSGGLQMSIILHEYHLKKTLVKSDNIFCWILLEIWAFALIWTWLFSLLLPGWLVHIGFSHYLCITSENIRLYLCLCIIDFIIVCTICLHERYTFVHIAGEHDAESCGKFFFECRFVSRRRRVRWELEKIQTDATKCTDYFPTKMQEHLSNLKYQSWWGINLMCSESEAWGVGDCYRFSYFAGISFNFLLWLIDRKWR